MALKININKKQLLLIIFMFYYCFLFLFQYVFQTFIGEGILIVLLPLLSYSKKERFSFYRYAMPILIMYLLIITWSTEIHKSFVYYLIMLEAVFFLKPTIDDLHIITDFIKITALINAFFVLFERLVPGIMTTYANIVFSDDAARAYTIALQRGYYSGLNNQVSFTAVYLSLGILVLTYDKNVYKSKKIIQLILLWISLFATNKRSHLIYLLITMLIVYYASSVKSKKIGRAVKAIFIVLVMVGFLYLVANIFSSVPIFARLLSLFTIFGGTGDLNSVSSGRIAIYNQVIELFKLNPIWGIGWQNYSDYSRYTSITGGVNQGHNVFLQLLCETGVIGFSFFIIINVHYLVSNFKINASIIKLRSSGEKVSKIDLYRKCSIGFIIFYYLFWFSGNAIYDFTFVYTWLISIVLGQTLKKNIINH